ncbi:hypothetical protein F0L74_24490 [Chitinophaga agrisoli]|uniref:Uncharacterized protein n=1 Tax=Chitinophaga agrisoli TaxID=2607653 RepID=A0A5B2VK61_9BACT|nr:hypothetical protein [Chitinophaga agrisoli]KAA2239365.1 hypothetical protein F0L74_24490 [Chitinophaga agrisoli]
MKKIALAFVALFAATTSLSAQDSTGAAQTTHIANILDNYRLVNTYFTVTGFRPVDNTVGSPYLYDDWGRLWIDSMENKPVKHSVGYEANLDLEKNAIIIRASGGQAYIPESGNIQAFHLVKNDVPAHFVNLNIDGRPQFVQLIAAGKYSLIKATKIRFERANFVDKGMTQTGHNYDEYRREYTYYLLKEGVLTKINFKRKSFLAAVEKDPAALTAAKKFLDSNDAYFNEQTAVSLVQAVNQL